MELIQIGQLGNTCPGTKENHTFDSGHCLTKCKETCVPHSVLLHIQNKVRTDKHQGQYISATTLLGCQRKTYLERTMPYFVEPPKNWYSMRGTLIHNLLQNPGYMQHVDDMRSEVERCFRKGDADRKQLEKRWMALEAQLMEFAQFMPKPAIPDWESEVEFEYPLGIHNGHYRYLRGTIDVLRRQMGKILDYKTQGDRGIGLIREGAKEDHVLQFNLYRFMVERGYPVGESYQTYRPIKINEIQAYYMTMMQVVGTGTNMVDITDYRKTDPESHKHEVSREVMSEFPDVVLKRGKRHATATPDDYELSIKKKWKMTYAVPAVPLMDLDMIEKFIHERAAVLIEAFDQGTMPEMVDQDTREWLCNFCPNEIKTRCDEVNAETGVQRVTPKANPMEIPVEASASAMMSTIPVEA